MNVSKRQTADQAAYVERVGRWWETVSGSRTAGRILGWLMICEPAHQSSQSLADTLKTSAGSVSMQTRHLESIGLVERVTFPGDRSSYYQLRPNAWEEMLAVEHERIKEMRGLARAAATVLPAERADRITELERMADFLIEEWPSLMSRLHERLSKETAS